MTLRRVTQVPLHVRNYSWNNKTFPRYQAFRVLQQAWLEQSQRMHLGEVDEEDDEGTIILRYERYMIQ